MRDCRGFSCNHRAGRHQRKAAWNDLVSRALPTAGILSLLEHLSVDRGNEKGSDSISVLLFSNGRCFYYWIAICVYTAAEMHVNTSVVMLEYTEDVAEESKWRKYMIL